MQLLAREDNVLQRYIVARSTEQLLPWKRNRMFHFYVCWHRCSCQQYKMFSASMEWQQRVPLALLWSYKILRTAVNKIKY
jgi:hypothetical protein